MTHRADLELEYQRYLSLREQAGEDWQRQPWRSTAPGSSSNREV